MSKIDTSVSPYWDDYSEDKKFYRILFKPGVALQARELTQLQTTLQKQIERLGKHIFVEGAQVIPGNIKYDLNYAWAQFDVNSYLVSSDAIETYWLNQRVICEDSGVEATVVNYLPQDINGQVTLFFKYEKANSVGTNLGTIFSFTPGQVVKQIADLNVQASVSLTGSGVDSSPIGIGSSATVDRGIYFVRGFFVLVDKQTIILDQFSNKPTCRVGLAIEESIITSEVDQSLNDVAQGTPNYAAPGADRYFIDLVLTSQDISETDTQDFIELLKLESGSVVSLVDISEYSVLNDTFARRTYEESGDYTVKPFMLDVIELYNENNNQGRFSDSDLGFSTQQEAEDFGTQYGLLGSFQSGGKYYPGLDYTTMQEQLRTWATIKIEPGLAYVQGVRINTYQQFLDIIKARGAAHVAFQDTTTINTPLGNYVNIENVKGVPDVSTFELVNLYDERLLTQPGSGRLIGTARVKAIENIIPPTGPGQADSGTYKLFLFDIALSPGKSLHNLKTITSVNGTSFVANVILEATDFIGTVASTSGTSVTLIGSGTQWVTSQTNQTLVPGDYISFISAGAKYFLEILSVSSDNSATATISPTLATGDGGLAYSYVWAQLYQSDLNTLVFPLDVFKIQAIRGSGGINDISQIFSIRRKFGPGSSTQADGGGIASIAVSYPEEFPAFDANTYIVVDPSGNFIPLTPSNYSFGSGNATFSVSGLTPGAQYTFIAPVLKLGSTASAERRKVLYYGPSANPNPAGVLHTTTILNPSLSSISLAQADVWKVDKITMAADFSTQATDNDIDITNRYEFDNGQRDNFYGIARVNLKHDVLPPTGNLKIVFSYFDHVGGGDYFSVDSYPIIPGVFEYKDIPVYVSNELGGTYYLRDCIDFRIKKTDEVTFSSNYEMPVSNFLASYYYYLNRIDLLCLQKNKQFILQSGVPGLDPIKPKTPENSMLLWELWVEGYTDDVSEINKMYIENKRYTMRDIGKLEKRIENIEYYTSLSLLEKETKDLKIIDSQGFDRFKNGFAVDSFSDYGIGDTSSLDYKCSIDMATRQLLPTFYHDQVSLIEDELVTEANAPESVRSSRGYNKTGDLYTLPRLSDVKFITQPYATFNISVNPYNVSTFIGVIKLDPPFDEWKETRRVPALIIEQQGNFAEMTNLANSLGTVWNEWQTTWTGQPIRTRTEHYTIRTEYGPNKPDKTHNHYWPMTKYRYAKFVTTVDSTQKRTGIKYEAIPKIIQTSLGDKVIDVSWVPFIRSKKLKVVGRGFLPYGLLNAFFDNVNVNELCRPLTNSSGISISGKFGAELKADGRGSITLEFWIPGIYSPFDWKKSASGENVLLSTEMPDGSQGAAEKFKFKTGQRLFVLTTNTNINSNDTPKAYGEATYTAQGLLETVQETIISTRNAELVARNVTEERNASTVISVEEKYYTKVIDPVAQAFRIVNPSKRGCFLSKVDLFFSGKPSSATKVPIRLQIRSMSDAGLPSNLLVPFSEVLLEWEDVHTNVIDTAHNALVIDGVRIPLPVIPADHFMATTFTFDSPIYLKESEDYAIVVMSDNDSYKVWGAAYTSGENTEGTTINGEGLETNKAGQNALLTENPYKDGVMFKSSNGLTWNPLQTGRLKFNLYKAQFNNNATSTIIFTNKDVPSNQLNSDPLTMYAASKFIRVFHGNHNHLHNGAGSTTYPPGFADYDNLQYVYINGVLGTTPDLTKSITAFSDNSLNKTIVTSLAHGLSDGDTIVVSGTTNYNGTYIIFDSTLNNFTIDIPFVSTETGTLTTQLLNGIPTSEINGTKQILFADPDSYIIETTTASNATSSCGGFNVSASENKIFETFMPTFGTIILPETSIDFSSSKTNTLFNNSDELLLENSYSPISINENNTLLTPAIVVSPPNEQLILEALQPSRAIGAVKYPRSLFIRASLRSVSPDISPTLDAQRMNLICIHNRLENVFPFGENAKNFSGKYPQLFGDPVPEWFDRSTLITTSTNLSTDGTLNCFYTEDPTEALTFQNLLIGKYIEVDGFGTNPANNGRFKITSVQMPGLRDINSLAEVYVDSQLIDETATVGNLYQWDNFIDEISPRFGSQYSKYVTQNIILANSSNALYVKFAAIREDGCFIDVYYKTLQAGDSQNFDQKPFTLAQPSGDISPSMPGQYRAYEYDIKDSQSFSAVVIKIVLRGNNSSIVPQIQDLQVVALDE